MCQSIKLASSFVAHTPLATDNAVHRTFHSPNRLKGKMPLGENSVWKDKIKPVKIEVKRAEGEEEGNFIASKFPANGRAYPFKVVEGRGVISEEGKKEADDDRGISGNSAANSSSTDQRSVAV